MSTHAALCAVCCGTFRSFPAKSFATSASQISRVEPTTDFDASFLRPGTHTAKHQDPDIGIKGSQKKAI